MSLLMLAFSNRLGGPLVFTTEGSATVTGTLSFGVGLGRLSWVRGDSPSELLRFHDRMAASKPTS